MLNVNFVSKAWLEQYYQQLNHEYRASRRYRPTWKRMSMGAHSGKLVTMPPDRDEYFPPYRHLQILYSIYRSIEELKAELA